MKTYEQITKIIVAMSDEIFDQICDAVTAFQLKSDMVAIANAEKILAEYDLTLAEYLVWEG